MGGKGCVMYPLFCAAHPNGSNESCVTVTGTIPVKIKGKSDGAIEMFIFVGFVTHP
jgi:hypothetical protein